MISHENVRLISKVKVKWFEILDLKSVYNVTNFAPVFLMGIIIIIMYKLGPDSFKYFCLFYSNTKFIEKYVYNVTVSDVTI